MTPPHAKFSPMRPTYFAKAQSDTANSLLGCWISELSNFDGGCAGTLASRR